MRSCWMEVVDWRAWLAVCATPHGTSLSSLDRTARADSNGCRDCYVRAVLSRLRLSTRVLQLTGLKCVVGVSVMAYASPPPRAALLSSATSPKRTR